MYRGEEEAFALHPRQLEDRRVLRLTGFQTGPGQTGFL